MTASGIRSPKGGFSALLGEAISNALCSLIICYCVVSFFAGQVGLLAYRDLGSTIVKMETNIGQLKEDNGKLLASKVALIGNDDRMTREARDIGFIKPGEKIVVLPSELHPAAQPRASESDEPLRVGPSTGLPDDFVKLLAALISAGVFFASFVMGLTPGRHRGFGVTADRS
ncbi:MAG: septum formation initiator family protein [Spirochaetes bacterium]|nr:septum formation initiator family protein [Spirochaetota bacterium]